MANTIPAYATAYTKLFRSLYETSALTSVFDRQADLLKSGYTAVSMLNISTVGLGNYSKTNGYPVGKVTAQWLPYILTQDRGREFSIDRIDDAGMMGGTAREAARVFVENWVTPEVDAYRFAKYYTGAGTKATPATLTAVTALGAIKAGLRVLDSKRVPRKDRYIFVSDEVLGFIEDGVGRQYVNDEGISSEITSINRVPVIMVPQSTFYSAITLDAGATETAGGFAKAAASSDLNFLIVQQDAVAQAILIDQLKIFDPDVNQEMDSFKIQHRIYHDAFVNTSFDGAIYGHAKVAA